MIINGSEVDYRLNFHYPDHFPRETCCKIEAVKSGEKFNDSGEVVGTGTAVCDSRDNFNKIIGRRIALSRALKDINKNERKVIWEGYLNHIKVV